MRFFFKQFVLIFVLIFFSSCSQTGVVNDINLPKLRFKNDNMFKKIRSDAVAGKFYPKDAVELKKQITKYLNFKAEQNIPSPEAIIVPHASYVFSASYAGKAFSFLKNKKVDNVFLISNAHSEFFKGIAIDSSDEWKTPLGNVPVNKKLAKKISAKSNNIFLNRDAHQKDHTLEVQIPFLQETLIPGFKIIPILFGQNNNLYQELSNILIPYLGDNDIIVISTDMSHYPSDADARKIDGQTLKIIQEQNIAELDKHIANTIGKVKGEETLLCGIDAVKTLLTISQKLNWQAELIAYGNSSEVSGDYNRVVGYGSFVFYEADNVLSQKERSILLDIAKQSVEAYVFGEKKPEFKINNKKLNKKQGAFVTLHKNGQLRGCIGQILPGDKPLWQVVQDMAISACSADSRFLPVSQDELSDIEYEISVLSKPRLISDWRRINLGKDGVIIKKDDRTGVFLPQVADETGWSLEYFLEELCSQKAGLARDCYKNDPQVKIYTFQAEVFE